MKKFRVSVERRDEYIIELDENVMTEQWMADFRNVFYDFDDLEEHAEHIAQIRARFETQDIEGYGSVLLNGNAHWNAKSENVNKAVNIRVISEDNDIEVDCYEI